ncbi:MAG TPA: TolC family protein [Vicinamibacteria bacterium]|nr:TolC family protein [Vicinamibacteria bacterium]
MFLVSLLFVSANSWADPGEGPAAGSRESSVPSLVALPARLTLDEALRIFRSQGLDLLIADAAVESARGDERIASAIYNPSVGLGRGKSTTYDPTQCTSPGCSDTYYQASVSEQGAIFDFLTGKRHLRMQVARAALEAAKLSRADAERTLSFTVKQQYVAAMLAKASLEFAGESQRSAEETLRLVGVRYRVGAVSEADVARAESAKLETEQAYDQAQQAQRQAKVTLAFLLGVRGTPQEFEVGDEFLNARVPAALGGASRESLLEVAISGRPDLKASGAQKTRAAASVSLAKRQRIPDLPLTVSYFKEGTGQNAISPPTTTVSLSLTVPLFYQNQGEVTKARADLKTQQLQHAKLEAQVLSDVAAGFSGFQGARSRAERMESRLLERTQRARDLVRIQYEKGAASLLELLDAQRTLIATHLERLQDLNDYWTSVFQLEQAVGTDLRQ